MIHRAELFITTTQWTPDLKRAALTVRARGFKSVNSECPSGSRPPSLRWEPRSPAERRSGSGPHAEMSGGRKPPRFGLGCSCIESLPASLSLPETSSQLALQTLECRPCLGAAPV